MTTDNDDIEKLVEAAAQESSSENSAKNSHTARQRLFRAIAFTEVFFPCNVDQHNRAVVRSTPLARLTDGSHAMMLFTSKSHPHLAEHKNFAGGAFRDTLAAAFKIPTLDWVILSNNAWHRVPIRKQQITAILDDLDSDDQGRAIEDLITESVSSETDQIAHRVGAALGERELFLELAAGQNEDGQPRMKTIQVAHLSHVVRAYTSRVRPGIRYGGIRWAALKDMVTAAPEIGGIQVMNSADDWIVFDRETLKTGLEKDTDPNR